MAVIKEALSSLPAKPALFIAPVLVVLVLSLYYRDQYNKCVDIRQTRAELSQHLLSLGAPARFRRRLHGPASGQRKKFRCDDLGASGGKAL